ncbi:hypothetical protein FUAX_28020 [Fulvitalea axinellae]|uniref:Uncharacterized protein n=1 Tax=Fulvitalea axinellae TaxID=1182444 RepID=A0AAU9CM09_9BACT|nr:hypothetical protein FUAX_28020 [Fulvitalea axinellae]
MLQISYFALLALILAMIFVGTSLTLKRMNTPPQKRKSILLKVTFGLIAWFAYVFTLSSTGFIESRDLPPRMPLLGILPTFLFTAFFLTTRRFDNFIKAIPASWLIYYQSFRIIVELIIWSTFLEGIIPKNTTFEGTNLDVMAGLTAPVVAYLVYNKRALPENFALAWNFASIAILAVTVFTFISTTFFPSIWANQYHIDIKAFASFPYVFIPTFFMPSAFFVHFVYVSKYFRKNSTKAKTALHAQS